jgi:hypothetical protein
MEISARRRDLAGCPKYRSSSIHSNCEPPLTPLPRFLYDATECKKPDHSEHADYLNEASLGARR